MERNLLRVGLEGEVATVNHQGVGRFHQLVQAFQRALRLDFANDTDRWVVRQSPHRIQLFLVLDERDADEVDDLQGTGGGMVLAPGQRGLVLDASYFGQSTTYDSMHTTALILTIDDRAFGRAGWSNSSEEAVILCDAHGDTVGFLVYTPEGRPGYSLEKIDPLGGDAPDNWALSRVQGGTPGAANSTASAQVAGGAAVEIATEPDPFSDQVEIEYRLATAPAVVNVTIFNVEGQVVRRLLTAAPSGASGKVAWHGRDDDGRAVPIGLYVVLIEASAEGRVARAKKVIARQNHP